MKTYSKVIVLSLATVLSAGGGFVLAQPTPAPVVNRPSTAPRMATVRGSGTPNTAGMRRGPGGEQPRMELARYALQEARRALEAAAPDKGGFREKAITNVDEALKNVEQGIAYAHAEEGGTARPAATRGATSK